MIHSFDLIHSFLSILYLLSAINPLLSPLNQNNQNINQIHTRHLYLLLLKISSTATSYSYLSLSLIRIESITSIDIVDGEEMLVTTGEKFLILSVRLIALDVSVEDIIDPFYRTSTRTSSKKIQKIYSTAPLQVLPNNNNNTAKRRRKRK